MAAVLAIINIILVLIAIVLVAVILMQQGNTAGLGSLGGGGAETFLGKNKARSLDGKLANLTKICAGIFIVLAILMVALQ